MAKITIIRPYEWNNQKKKIKVYIDDKQVGSVGIEERMSFDVSPGKHTLKIRDQWPGRSTSIEVDLKNNQNKTINMSTYKRRFWAPFLIALLTTMGYSIVRSLLNIESNWSIDIPVIAFMIAVTLMVFTKTKNFKLEEEVN